MDKEDSKLTELDGVLTNKFHGRTITTRTYICIVVKILRQLLDLLENVDPSK